MRRISAALLVTLSFLTGPALAQTFPLTLPENSVYGRLGVGSGPGQAIPFSILSSRLGAAKLGDFLDFVLDYGAVGDDATDNSTAWQNFVAAVTSTGKPGYVPPGTYRLTTGAASAAPAGNFHIYGDGRFSLIKRMNNVTSPILAVTSGSPIVESLGFQYANASTTADGNHEAVRFVGTTNGKIRNVYVTGAFYVGLELRNDSGGTLDSNYVVGAYNRGLFVNTTTTGTSTNASVVNNVVDGTSATHTTDYCINVTVGTSGTMSDITVLNNRVDNCASQGISMVAGSFSGVAGNSSIVGNNVANILGAGGTGILVQLDNGIQPTGVTVAGNAVNNTAAVGVAANGSLFGTISGNTINNSPTGIETQISGATVTSRTAVTGNSIVNAASGIIDLQSSYQAIAGNSIQATAVGVNIAGSDHCVVASNNISVGATGAIGINFVASTSNAATCLARNNQITVLSGSGTFGIKTDAGSSGISAELNKINGAGTALSIAGSNNNTAVQLTDGGTGVTTIAALQAALNYPLITFSGGTISLNTTNTDTAIAIASPSTNYRLSALYLSNCTGSITTATFGVFTATGGGGAQLVATTTGAVTASSAGSAASLQSINGIGTIFTNVSSLQFRNIVAQGSAVTCSVAIQIQPLP